MGWTRTLLLGGIGNRLDIEEMQREIARLEQDVASRFDKDMTQDKKIDALIAENAEFKLYLASVVLLLTTKGTISSEELRGLVGGPALGVGNGVMSQRDDVDDCGRPGVSPALREKVVG